MDFLNTTQASKEFGISESWLAKLRLTGAGPIYCKVGKRVIYRRDDITRWLQSHSRASTSQHG